MRLAINVVLVVLGVLGPLPRIAHADLRVAIRNDVFTEAAPPIDDNGFTHDFDLHFWRPYRDYLVGVRFVDRWVTEDVMTGGRRRDLVDLLATAERTWGEPLVRELTPSLRVGPTFTGNLGGRWIQNAFHTSCGCGRSLDEGLQDTYEGSAEAGIVAAARVRGSIGVPRAQVFGHVDGRGSVGTGVSAFEAAAGGRLLGARGENRVGIHLELAVMRFHLADDRFALRGAYRGGWQGAWRLGLHYARGRVRVDYEYRANEDGSGEPIGVVAVTVKQAGTTW